MSGRVFIMSERVNKSISWSTVYCTCIFNTTRTGSRTGNGFKITIFPPPKQKREILFEATRTCIWLKLDVCSMCMRFATQRTVIQVVKLGSIFCQSEWHFHHFLTLKARQIYSLPITDCFLVFKSRF